MNVFPTLQFPRTEVPLAQANVNAGRHRPRLCETARDLGATVEPAVDEHRRRRVGQMRDHAGGEVVGNGEPVVIQRDVRGP